MSKRIIDPDLGKPMKIRELDKRKKTEKLKHYKTSASQQIGLNTDIINSKENQGRIKSEQKIILKQTNNQDSKNNVEKRKYITILQQQQPVESQKSGASQTGFDPKNSQRVLQKNMSHKNSQGSINTRKKAKETSIIQKNQQLHTQQSQHEKFSQNSQQHMNQNNQNHDIRQNAHKNSQKQNQNKSSQISIKHSQYFKTDHEDWLIEHIFEENSLQKQKLQFKNQFEQNISEKNIHTNQNQKDNIFQKIQGPNFNLNSKFQESNNKFNTSSQQYLNQLNSIQKNSQNNYKNMVSDGNFDIEYSPSKCNFKKKKNNQEQITSQNLNFSLSNNFNNQMSIGSVNQFIRQETMENFYQQQCQQNSYNLNQNTSQGINTFDNTNSVQSNQFLVSLNNCQLNSLQEFSLNKQMMNEQQIKEDLKGFINKTENQNSFQENSQEMSQMLDENQNDRQSAIYKDKDDQFFQNDKISDKEQTNESDLKQQQLQQIEEQSYRFSYKKQFQSQNKGFTQQNQFQQSTERIQFDLQQKIGQDKKIQKTQKLNWQENDNITQNTFQTAQDLLQQDEFTENEINNINMKNKEIFNQYNYLQFKNNNKNTQNFNIQQNQNQNQNNAIKIFSNEEEGDENDNEDDDDDYFNQNQIQNNKLQDNCQIQQHFLNQNVQSQNSQKSINQEFNDMNKNLENSSENIFQQSVNQEFLQQSKIQELNRNINNKSQNINNNQLCSNLKKDQNQQIKQQQLNESKYIKAFQPCEDFPKKQKIYTEKIDKKNIETQISSINDFSERQIESNLCSPRINACVPEQKFKEFKTQKQQKILNQKSQNLNKVQQNKSIIQQVQDKLNLEQQKEQKNIEQNKKNKYDNQKFQALKNVTPGKNKDQNNRFIIPGSCKIKGSSISKQTFFSRKNSETKNFMVNQNLKFEFSKFKQKDEQNISNNNKIKDIEFIKQHQNKGNNSLNMSSDFNQNFRHVQNEQIYSQKKMEKSKSKINSSQASLDNSLIYNYNKGQKINSDNFGKINRVQVQIDLQNTQTKKEEKNQRNQNQSLQKKLEKSNSQVKHVRNLSIQQENLLFNQQLQQDYRQKSINQKKLNQTSKSSQISPLNKIVKQNYQNSNSIQKKQKSVDISLSREKLNFNLDNLQKKKQAQKEKSNENQKNMLKLNLNEILKQQQKILSIHTLINNYSLFQI
ncbi:hypothetical protein PPERSA_11744 [Pseudocohnilembus persalinus]|uniref:Uncharacterized protein n=1 Tax=Pseudocohnilembus persalinus TaxID=266149 RepID=A0A0V0QGB4_PSEPJ|nr:hypothetical protein PPERSA_11744 [Pseudocohnilembus persalinus]|eukprot:KRX01297.1 hypothetical protein PPERSA_11744 [Pseudocohnilembus persalinus]